MKNKIVPPVEPVIQCRIKVVRGPKLKKHLNTC